MAVRARKAGKGFPAPDGYIAVFHGFAVATHDNTALEAANISIINRWKRSANEKGRKIRPPSVLRKIPQLHPLVAPQVSHFSQVPLRTIVKLEHSEHMLPVYP